MKFAHKNDKFSLAKKLELWKKHSKRFQEKFSQPNSFRTQSILHTKMLILICRCGKFEKSWDIIFDFLGESLKLSQQNQNEKMWCKIEKCSVRLFELQFSKEPDSYSLMSPISIQESWDTKVGFQKTILKQFFSSTIAKELLLCVLFLIKVCYIQCVEKAQTQLEKLCFSLWI